MKKPRAIFSLMTVHHLFVRSVYAEILLEDFFVAAVASVLAIRLYLRLTGYPQVTVGGLHIAHVLWGGLLMLVSLIMLLAFLNRYAKQIAAVVGGAGFGAFVDELGKFITSDNDYFFEPAVALIYVLFVLLFFAIRFLAREPSLTPEECYANAYEIAEQASIIGLDPEEQDLARRLLEKCGLEDSEHLRNILLGVAPAESHRPSLLARARDLLDQFYEYAAPRWWFTGLVISFFTVTAFTASYALLAVVEWSLALALWFAGGVSVLVGLLWSHRRRPIGVVSVLASAATIVVLILLSWAILSNIKQLPLSLLDWAQFVFPGISGALIIAGVLLIPRSRLRAYNMFRRATLVSIFLTQVLSFYEQQLFALVGLVGNIFILLALRYMISHEEIKIKEKVSSTG